MLPSVLVGVFSFVLAPTAVRAQFGYGAEKLMQTFHLPASPASLETLIMEYFIKQKVGNTLPLALNANDLFPSIGNEELPGGPFAGQPLTLTSARLLSPLSPGDYVLPVTAYCTQYSVHRPGQGTAYKLAPVQGTEAEVISTLLWRGTMTHKRPQDLQTVSWAIQSGILFDRLPKPYQTLVDELIPDYRTRLQGNTLDIVQSTYEAITADPRKFVQTYITERYHKSVPLMFLPKLTVPAPPLDQILLKLGPAGHAMLDAKKQTSIFKASYSTQERGEQVLFSGQGDILPPQLAVEGAWTVRVPNVAYVRLKVEGGNMQSNNLLEIRILPSSPVASESNATEPVDEAGNKSRVPPTSVYGLLGVTTAPAEAKLDSMVKLTASGVIGYSQGGNGAQALIIVANAPLNKAAPKISLSTIMYKKQVIRGDDLKTYRGVCVYIGADIQDPDQVYSQYRWEQIIHTDVPPKDCPFTSYADPCLANDQWHAGGEASKFYRPVGNEKDWHNYLGHSYVFRDEPRRPDSVFQWHGKLQLIGLTNGTSSEDTIAEIDYGVSRDSHGNLITERPSVQGTPLPENPPSASLADYLCNPRNRPKDPNEPTPVPESMK